MRTRERGRIRFDREAIFRRVRAGSYVAILDGVVVKLHAIRGRDEAHSRGWRMLANRRRVPGSWESLAEAQADAVLFILMGYLEEVTR